MLRVVLISVSAFIAVSHGGSGAGGIHYGQSSSVTCPGSPSSYHAWLTVELEVSATCASARDEMIARVAGQHDGTWRDPHRGGGGQELYTLLEETESQLIFSRISSNGRYTDKQLFQFTEGTAENTCEVTGCSESQGSSGGDQSTNYCNLRNLYCGSAESCCPVNSDFSWVETRITKSSGAGTDAQVCLGGHGGSGGGFGGEAQVSCLTQPQKPPAPTLEPTRKPTLKPSIAPTLMLTLAPTLAQGGSGLAVLEQLEPTLAPTPTLVPTFAQGGSGGAMLEQATPTLAPTLPQDDMGDHVAVKAGSSTPTFAPTSAGGSGGSYFVQAEMPASAPSTSTPAAAFATSSGDASASKAARCAMSLATSIFVVHLLP